MAKKVNGLRWWIIGLIFLATVINYIDRSALGIMWGGEDVDGSIAQSLSLTKEHYAWIANVFMVAYAIGQLLSGKVFDKIGTRAGYVISIVVWGASTAFHAVARGALSFGFFRATLGISEAGNWPGAVKSNAEWFPIKERAIAQGLFNAGASVGSVIAPLIMVLLGI
jgi:ACS family hexuronate transporter-like MFS transporter